MYSESLPNWVPLLLAERALDNQHRELKCYYWKIPEWRCGVLWIGLIWHWLCRIVPQEAPRLTLQPQPTGQAAIPAQNWFVALVVLPCDSADGSPACHTFEARDSEQPEGLRCVFLIPPLLISINVFSAKAILFIEGPWCDWSANCIPRSTSDRRGIRGELLDREVGFSEQEPSWLRGVEISGLPFMLQFGVRVPNDDDPSPYCSYIPTQGSWMDSRDPITRTGSSHYRTARNIVHAATPCHWSIFSKHWPPWTVDDLPVLLPRMTLRHLIES